jgi:hypothetical protein
VPHLRRRPLTAALAAAALAGAALLTSCSSSVSLEPAEAADDPGCADVSVRLPSTVDVDDRGEGQQRRWTDAQATAAWGEPAAVILTCGVTPPGPTEAQCITIGGVDWIVDESDAPRYLLTTYGRTPAVQVFLDNETVSPNAVLSDLSSAVGAVPQSSACVETAELLP